MTKRKQLKINERLRQARRKRLWSLEQTAESVGVSYQTYFRWEHYTQQPHLTTLALLCKTFEMTAEELGFGDIVGTIWNDAPKYASCFLSHSSMDLPFVERLYVDLQNAGVSCWYAPANIQIGDNFRQKIEDAISTYDTFLLVLSENSIRSSPVQYEVDTALSKERNQFSKSLYPIYIDNAIWQQHESIWLRNIVETYHLGNFTQWREHEAYHKSLDQLLHSLLLKK